MHRLIELSIARPRSTVVAWLLATLLVVPFLLRMRLDTDPRHVFGRGAPILADDRRMRETFKLYDFVAVAVVKDSGAFNPDTLNRFFHASREIKQIPGVMPLDVFSPENVEDIQQAAGDIATTPVSIVKLQKDEIRDQADADAILARIRANPVLRGKLASDDGKVLTLFVAFDPAEAQSAAWSGWMPRSLEELRGKFVPAGPGRRVASEVERICRRYAAPDERIYVTGLPVDAEAVGTGMARGIAVLGPAILLLLWLLTWGILRRPRAAPAPAVVAAISCVWALAALAALGSGLQPLSSLAPLLLLPLAAAGPLSFLRDARRRSAPAPLVTAALVQIACFGSLVLFPVPDLRAAGVILTAGTLVAALLTLSFVPAWSTLVRDPEVRDVPGPGESIAGRRARVVLLAASAASFAVGMGVLRLHRDDDATRLLRKSQAARQAEERFDVETSGVQYDYLTIEGAEEDGMKDPALLHYLEQVQRELEKSPIVRATTALPDVVKKIRYELFNDPAKNVLPERRDESAQMLFVYEISGGNPDKLFHLVTPDYSKAAIWIQMNSQDQDAVREVTDRFDRFVASHPLPGGLVVHWTGVPFLSTVSETAMARAAARSALLAIGMVALILLALVRPWRRTLVVLTPAILSLAVAFGALGWAGASYDASSALLFALVLAAPAARAVLSLDDGGAQRAGGGREALLALAVLPMFFSALTASTVLACGWLAAVAIAAVLTPIAVRALAPAPVS